MDNKDSNNTNDLNKSPNEGPTVSSIPNYIKKPLTSSNSLPINGMNVGSLPSSPNIIRNIQTSALLKNSPQLHRVFSELRPPSPSLSITRPVYNVDEFNKNYIPNEIQKTTKEKFKSIAPDFSRKAWISRMKGCFPISVWIPQYNIRQNLIADIVVGITIASFQVPQSMGYALIADVNPVYGLYTAFFPALMYLIFGTSFHSSVGPVAIVAGLMTANIIVDVSADIGLDYETGDTTNVIEGFEGIQTIDIAVMISMIIGLYLLILGCFRLGFISNYLSDELVSGFMTSAAIHVFTTQIRYLFGVELKNRSGILAVPLVYVEFFGKLKSVNLTAFIISIICVSILLIFKLGIERLFQKMGLKLPFPIHLFIMIGGCIASWLMDLKSEYDISVVGNIPDEFKSPTFPKFILFKYMWHRCIPIAVVSYILTLSVGRLYANKHNYKINANQEMVALGICNIWSSFFMSLASCASIPRSSVQESGGGKTQIVSLVNSDLPKCVLASCIACALASIFAKFQEFLNFWRISKLDGVSDETGIWLITFLSVVILNVDYGIYCGFGCSLLLLIYKSQRPKTYSLGSVDDSDIYVPLSKFKRAKELEGVKIYQFCGPLNFANVPYFKKELQIRSGVDVTAIKEEMLAMTPSTSCFVFTETKDYKAMTEKYLEHKKNLPKYIIIDCSMLSYIDTSGVTELKKLVQNHSDIDIMIQLTGCPVHIETVLKRDGFFKEVSSDRVYKSVHDAISFIRQSESTIGQPIQNLDQNNKRLFPRIVSNMSLDSLASSYNGILMDDRNDMKTPDSPKSIMRNSPRNSPQLNRSISMDFNHIHYQCSPQLNRSTRSVTFSDP
ncbi:unnamed protein product [Oppiella nova]|uniref:STAS domain-containing protein n=1 Tax=Oppiella nova TaxID=334625 RepID=A0A7R9LVA1_9ACAR|nr:unnamed protein product [Oppiella nova]CAG2167190.1 unnamed protein product [Oppiella nova]